MFDKVKELVSRHLNGGAQESAADHARALRLATAALLVEMSRADADESGLEQQQIVVLISSHFELSNADAQELFSAATSRADHAVSLHEFTSLLNATLSVADKHDVIELLWRVAFADAELDRYEDHLVRKVADLLYVPHSEFIRLKLKVQEALSN